MTSTGVDIGGTGTSIGLVDDAGTILSRVHYAMPPGESFTCFTDDLARRIRELWRSQAIDSTCVGVGAPCGNHFTGEIMAPVHFDWGTVNLEKALSERLGGARVKITNDANAAAIGEHAFGAARGMDDFIEITLGTGVGSGIFSGGKLVYGHRGMAGELGHLRYFGPEGRLCGCGRRGCLDPYCSARGLVLTMRELLESNPRRDSRLRENFHFDAREVAKAAKEGDELALLAFSLTGEKLGSAIVDMVTFGNPEAVVLFGGLARSGNLLLEPTRDAFKKNVLPMYADTRILLSTLPESDAAILGAAQTAKTDD